MDWAYTPSLWVQFESIVSVAQLIGVMLYLPLRNVLHSLYDRAPT